MLQTARHDAYRATMLDNVKALGYKYSTISGLTTSVFDMNIPSEKQEIMHEAEKKVIEIENNFNEGFLTENERYKIRHRRVEGRCRQGGRPC